MLLGLSALFLVYFHRFQYGYSSFHSDRYPSVSLQQESNMLLHEDEVDAVNLTNCLDFRTQDEISGGNSF
jgi:hypothetical protein